MKTVPWVTSLTHRLYLCGIMLLVYFDVVDALRKNKRIRGIKTTPHDNTILIAVCISMGILGLCFCCCRKFCPNGFRSMFKSLNWDDDVQFTNIRKVELDLDERVNLLSVREYGWLIEKGTYVSVLLFFFIIALFLLACVTV